MSNLNPYQFRTVAGRTPAEVMANMGVPRSGNHPEFRQQVDVDIATRQAANARKRGDHGSAELIEKEGSKLIVAQRIRQDRKGNLYRLETHHGYASESKTRRPLTHVYRAVSDEDWQRIQTQGYLDTDGRGNMIHSGPEKEGMVAASSASTSYLAPPKSDSFGRLMKIRVHPDDGWEPHYIDGDRYVHTHKQVPIDRVEAVSPRISYDWMKDDPFEVHPSARRASPKMPLKERPR